MSEFYDRDGRSIDMMEWTRLMRTNRHIAFDLVGDHNEHTVSTVWIGIDHRFGLGGPPLIFETMVFPECDICERTPTEVAALAMHDQVLAEVRRRSQPRLRRWLGR